MNGWKRNYFPFGAIGVFSGANMLVSGSDKKNCKFITRFFFKDPLLYPLRSPKCRNAAMPVMEGFPDIPSSHLFRQDMADGPPSGYEPCQVRKARKQEGIFWKGDILGGGFKHFFIFTQKNNWK